MEKEKQLLLLCRELIERSLNWGDSITWGNDDFEQLSEKIFEKTKVQLSVSTLKRIWGKVRYENFPTTATLNALATFLDYDSWREFRQKNQLNEKPPVVDEEVVITTLETGPITETDVAAKKNSLRYIAIVIVAIVVAGLIFIATPSFRHKKLIADPSKIKFEAIKVSDNLPNSVIFNYDASAFHSDSVYIQQSWDERRRERVPGDGKQYTSIYYEPGFFVSKLIVDNEIKKQGVIFIKTRGWKGIIEKAPVPAYLSDEEIKGDGFMGITQATLQKKLGTPVFNDSWVKFANVREFKDIDAGNFVFETHLRNTSAMEASVCRQIKVLLLGTYSAIIIPLGDKGCVSSLDLLTGDVWVGGKNHDMRAFGCDFSQFQDLKCVVANDRFTVFLNDKKIYDRPQKRTLHEIVGIRFEVEGTAEIKDVALSTPGKGSYYDNFRAPSKSSPLASGETF